MKSLYLMSHVKFVIKASQIIKSRSSIDFEVRLFGEQTSINFKRYLKPNDCVKILGRVTHKRMQSEYQKSDIVALPFRRPEAFGRVVVEAMSLGLPVISCATGGVSELIINKRTGLLVPPADVSILAQSIESLLNDAGLRQSIGKFAADTVRKQYDPSVIAKKTIQLYSDLIGN